MHVKNLQLHRAAAKQAWSSRKRVLDPLWDEKWQALPCHVRAVLGPKKNLLLLEEMLAAAECPDSLLIRDLMVGSPLIGFLSRGGLSLERPLDQPVEIFRSFGTTTHSLPIPRHAH